MTGCIQSSLLESILAACGWVFPWTAWVRDQRVNSLSANAGLDIGVDSMVTRHIIFWLKTIDRLCSRGVSLCLSIILTPSQSTQQKTSRRHLSWHLHGDSFQVWPNLSSSFEWSCPQSLWVYWTGVVVKQTAFCFTLVPDILDKGSHLEQIIWPLIKMAIWPNCRCCNFLMNGLEYLFPRCKKTCLFGRGVVKNVEISLILILNQFQYFLFILLRHQN